VRSKVINIKDVAGLILQVYAKLQKSGDYILLAICDEELLGKVLEDGKLVFKVGEEFYKGPKMPVTEAIALVEESTVVNMIGTNIVNKAISCGLVHPEAVLNICGIPHAQIIKV
jgi:hypothetical protein